MDRAHIITSLNRKGGVGKTHLCWLIASVCVERGRQCLLIDLDPQANLTSSFLSDDQVQSSVERLFDVSAEPDLRTLLHETAYPEITLVPSSARLEPYNVSDEAQWRENDLQLSLRESLAEIADEFDYILLDCPPSLSLVSYAALCASDAVLIPLEAARWGALGTQQIAAAVEDVQRRFNNDLSLLGYVVSRYKQRRAYQQAHLRQLREHFGEAAFETFIPDLATFEKSVTDRIPLTLHSPTSDASDIARRFFEEVEARAQRLRGRGSRRRQRRVRLETATQV